MNVSEARDVAARRITSDMRVALQRMRDRIDSGDVDEYADEVSE